MIRTIARKEFVEMLRDGRFRWAASIVLPLLALALLAGAYYQRELVARQRAAQAAEQARWYAQEPKNPHSAAHYGLYAFKPRLAPAFLDPGVEPYTGVAVWLEAHKQNEMLYRPGEDATLAQRFGELTVALIVQVVLPLVVILLVFNAFAGERERGTLRQLLSLGLRPRDLVLGKMLGLGGALGLMVAPAVVLAAVALALTGPTEGAPRFALLALVFLVYIGTFVLLALAISARSPSAGIQYGRDLPGARPRPQPVQRRSDRACRSHLRGAGGAADRPAPPSSCNTCGEPQAARRLRDHRSNRAEEDPPSAHRALEFLMKHGLVHRIESRNAYLACTHNHDSGALVAFLMCESCGAVGEASTAAMSEVLAAAAKRAGFRPNMSVIEITGTCSHCRGG
jgi:Fe2+ or Zn2+ uptake regulation protein/ABC-type transport system involved in multi-copper enzyme maturation permease subunit